MNLSSTDLFVIRLRSMGGKFFTAADAEAAAPIVVVNLLPKLSWMAMRRLHSVVFICSASCWNTRRITSFCDFNRSRAVSAFSSCANSSILLSLRNAGQLNSLVWLGMLETVVLLPVIRVGTTRLVGFICAWFDFVGVAPITSERCWTKAVGDTIWDSVGGFGVNVIRFGLPFGVKLGKSLSWFVGELRSCVEFMDFRCFCCLVVCDVVIKSPKQKLDAFAVRRISFDLSCVDRALLSKLVLLLLSSNDFESLDEWYRELWNVDCELRLWLFPLRLAWYEYCCCCCCLNDDGVLVDDDTIDIFFAGVLNACAAELFKWWTAIGVRVLFKSPVNSLYMSAPPDGGGDVSDWIEQNDGSFGLSALGDANKSREMVLLLLLMLQPPSLSLWVLFGPNDIDCVIDMLTPVGCLTLMVFAAPIIIFFGVLHDDDGLFLLYSSVWFRTKFKKNTVNSSIVHVSCSSANNAKNHCRKFSFGHSAAKIILYTASAMANGSVFIWLVTQHLCLLHKRMVTEFSPWRHRRAHSSVTCHNKKRTKFKFSPFENAKFR